MTLFNSVKQLSQQLLTEQASSSCLENIWNQLVSGFLMLCWFFTYHWQNTKLIFWERTHTVDSFRMALLTETLCGGGDLFYLLTFDLQSCFPNITNLCSCKLTCLNRRLDGKHNFSFLSWVHKRVVHILLYDWELDHDLWLNFILEESVWQYEHSESSKLEKNLCPSNCFYAYLCMSVNAKNLKNYLT